MPIPSDLYEKISHLVSENRVNSAIELLEEQLPALRQSSPEQYHAALILMQDFNEIQERKINGLLVAETETNSFSFRLLEFSRKLGRKKYTPPPPPPPSPDPLRMAQPAYAAPPPRPATGPVNARGPVNAKPGRQGQQHNNNGGFSFGKLVMYGLAGLGCLLIIGLLFAEDEDGYNDYDPDYQEEPVYHPDPSGGTYTPATTLPAVTIANARQILGNSTWKGKVLGQMIFDASGTTASYLNGSSSLAILGDENGNLFGTYAGFTYGGAILSFSADQQTMTITSVDGNGNATEELIMKRQ